MISPNRVHPALPLETANTVPFPKQAPQPNKLALLVKLEGELRQQPTWQATIFHALNEPQLLLGHVQAFFFRANTTGKLNCTAAASIATIETRSPFILALNKLMARIDDPSKPLAFDLEIGPHKFALWLPMFDGQKSVFGGFLFCRDDAWSEDQQKIAVRIAEAYAHALRLFKPPKLLRSFSLPRWAKVGLPLVTLALAVIPVPLTTLAPFEVVPRDPAPVTAPLDGVIKTIFQEPNTQVKRGDVLFELDTTELMAAVEVAAQKVTVAESRLATTRASAFADKEAKRNLATLEQELDLAKAEYDQSNSRLLRAKIVADANGVFVYGSKSDLLGKPVRVGEKVMDIANPQNIGFRIDVGVHDSIALDSSDSIRLFFDANPLNPASAHVYEKSFHATERASGQFTYTVRAELNEGEDTPRIGLRGTAQLIGDWVPLGFYIFRRPIAAARQYVGI